VWGVTRYQIADALLPEPSPARRGRVPIRLGARPPAGPRPPPARAGPPPAPRRAGRPRAELARGPGVRDLGLAAAHLLSGIW
jgi:hypothetical protein